MPPPSAISLPLSFTEPRTVEPAERRGALLVAGAEDGNADERRNAGNGQRCGDELAFPEHDKPSVSAAR